MDAQFGLLIAATLAASVAAGTMNRRAELSGLILAIAASASFAGPDLASGASIPEEWLIGRRPCFCSWVALAGLPDD